MKRGILFLLVFVVGCLCDTTVQAQKSGKVKISGNVSCPEKWWAIMHPFIAGKAYSITLSVLKVSDSLRKESLTNSTLNSGQLDAFKHAYWMASLVQEMNWRKARNLGRAHERGNYKSFKKEIRFGKEGSHDEVDRRMDLWNNDIGIKTGLLRKGIEPGYLMTTVIDSIRAGAMKIIAVNNAGHFLDCNGNIIPAENLTGKWENDKCLIPSDSVIK
jgi:hypothetical protein